MQHDWLRPTLYSAVVLLGIALGVWIGNWLHHGLNLFQPSAVASAVQEVAEGLPKVVVVPSATPTLTPSVTPTPSLTPTPTPTPSLTPTPTQTPTPTETPSPTPTETPTPTATRVWPTWTPKPRASATPTPSPTAAAAAPVLSEPENMARFDGEKAIIKLAWSSNYFLQPDQCYLVTLRWTERGAPASNLTCVQDKNWFVDDALYLRADQETERVYYWSVRIVRRGTDADGARTYTPVSAASEERFFYWK